MGYRRVCSIAGCTREAMGEMCLNEIEYEYLKDKHRTKKTTKRIGRLTLCQHHFDAMKKWFGNYHAIIERVGDDPDEYTG